MFDWEKRFWSKVDKNAPNGCWVWTGGRKSNGYGVFHIKNIQLVSHRVSYELTKGELPKSALVDHKCHNRLCVNPDHLRCCDHRHNMMNRLISSNSKSKLKGVSWDKINKSWRAFISNGIKNISLGTFASKEDAYLAYLKAAREMHGEFFNPG